MAVDNEGRKIMEKKKEILGKLIIRAVHKRGKRYRIPNLSSGSLLFRSSKFSAIAANRVQVVERNCVCDCEV